MRIEPRPELWRRVDRKLVQSGRLKNGVKFEIWSPCTPEDNRFEEMIKKFKGGKSRFLRSQK